MLTIVSILGAIMRRLVALTLSAFLLVALSAPSAEAGPTDGVEVTDPPTGSGDAFSPGVRPLPSDYVEEEYFVSGRSTLFNYAHNPPLGPTDLVAVQSDVPYETRIIVRRPKQDKKFNGTVVVEWWNSTAGFDTAPVWDPSAEYFAENGIAYVGVTNSTTSIGHLTSGCSLFGVLPPTCGTRYSSLSLPENGLAYEMMSQIANLIASDDPSNPLPASYDVEQILHAGESQQAGSIVTYASAFHLPGVNDGYFIQSGSSARPVNFGPACGSQGAPPFPDCTPRLAHPDDLVRTDLPVPVYQVMTQTDIDRGVVPRGRQPDTGMFRYYEIAGGAHLTVHKGIEIIPAGLIGPDPLYLEDACLNEMNTTADGPVFVSHVLNALWQRMQEQNRSGAAPPAGALIDQTNGVLHRDAFGNVTGGVRLPSMEAPTATYESFNVGDPALPPFLQGIGNLACRLSGSVFPFEQSTLDTLYKNHGAYVSQVGKSVNALRAQGLLLQSDAVKIRRAAAASPIGNP